MNKNLDPGKIKAFALDLDGTTLLPDTSMGERTVSVLKKLMSNGKQIIFATGRAVQAVAHYQAITSAEGPMVFFNGAEVVDIPCGKLLHASLVSNDVMDFCIDLSRDMGVFFQVYLPAGISVETGKFDPSQKWETLLQEKPGPEAENYQKHTGIIPVVKDLKTITSMPDLKGCIKGMFILDPSLHVEIRQKLNDRFPNRINIIRSFPTFIEVTNAGVTKGEGLKIAMLYRGLKPEEVFAFGDEENDLSMFEAAGFSAAPISAREVIRSQADFIYGPIAEEGLAIYLEQTFL